MSDSNKILDSITTDDRRSNPSTSGSGIRVGMPEDILQTTGKLLSEPQRKLVSTFAKKCHSAAKESNGVWLQDVILCTTPRNAEELVRKIKGYVSSYGRSVLFITSHDSHVHVNHDCAYAGGSCRCFWRKKIQEEKTVDIRRRLLRPGGRRRIRELKLSDWYRIVLYFTTEGRRTESPYIDGEVSRCSVQFHWIFMYNNLFYINNYTFISITNGPPTSRYNTYLMKCQVWKCADLKGQDGKPVPWQEKKNLVWKEFQMTYTDFSSMAKAMIAIEDAAVQHLVQAKKNGRKIKACFPNYKPLYTDFQ